MVLHTVIFVLLSREIKEFQSRMGKMNSWIIPQRLVLALE